MRISKHIVVTSCNLQLWNQFLNWFCLRSNRHAPQQQTTLVNPSDHIRSWQMIWLYDPDNRSHKNKETVKFHSTYFVAFEDYQYQLCLLNFHIDWINRYSFQIVFQPANDWIVRISLGCANFSEPQQIGRQERRHFFVVVCRNSIGLKCWLTFLSCTKLCFVQQN